MLADGAGIGEAGMRAAGFGDAGACPTGRLVGSWGLDGGIGAGATFGRKASFTGGASSALEGRLVGFFLTGTPLMPFDVG